MLFLGVFLAFSSPLLLETVSVGSFQAPLNKYLIMDYKVTFFEAWRHCQHYGLQLASVKSKKDNQFMHELLSRSEHANDTFWLAGTDTGLEGKWIWISTNHLVTLYIHWGGISPELDDILNCMTVGSFSEDRTLWRDDYCETPHKFICQKSWTVSIRHIWKKLNIILRYINQPQESGHSAKKKTCFHHRTNTSFAINCLFMVNSLTKNGDKFALPKGKVPSAVVLQTYQSVAQILTQMKRSMRS